MKKQSAKKVRLDREQQLRFARAVNEFLGTLTAQGLLSWELWDEGEGEEPSFIADVSFEVRASTKNGCTVEISCDTDEPLFSRADDGGVLLACPEQIILGADPGLCAAIYASWREREKKAEPTKAKKRERA